MMAKVKMRELYLLLLFLILNFTTFAQSNQTNPITASLYTVVTGWADNYSPITPDELRRRLDVQSYHEIVLWLRSNSSHVTESSKISFDRLTDELVDTFKQERNIAESDIKNIGNRANYRWLTDATGHVTVWIVYEKR